MNRKQPLTGTDLIAGGVRDVYFNSRDADGLMDQKTRRYHPEQLSGALEGEFGWISVSGETKQQDGSVRFVISDGASEERAGRVFPPHRTVGALDDWSKIPSENLTPEVNEVPSPAPTAADAVGEFVEHLKSASETVKTWPEWKQRVLGNVLRPMDIPYDGPMEQDTMNHTGTVYSPVDNVPMGDSACNITINRSDVDSAFNYNKGDIFKWPMLIDGVPVVAFDSAPGAFDSYNPAFQPHDTAAWEKQNGKCFRTACRSALSSDNSYRHTLNFDLYCTKCARAINYHNPTSNQKDLVLKLVNNPNGEDNVKCMDCGEMFPDGQKQPGEECPACAEAPEQVDEATEKLDQWLRRRELLETPKETVHFTMNMPHGASDEAREAFEKAVKNHLADALGEETSDEQFDAYGRPAFENRETVVISEEEQASLIEAGSRTPEEKKEQYRVAYGGKKSLFDLHSFPGGYAKHITETVRTRGGDYGSPADNHQLTADMLGAWLCRRHGIQIDLTAEDVCVINMIQKMSRLAYSSKDDSYMDIAGYAENVAMLRTEQRSR